MQHSTDPPPLVNTNPPKSDEPFAGLLSGEPSPPRARADVVAAREYFLGDCVIIGNRTGVVLLVFADDILVRLDPAFGRPREMCVAPKTQARPLNFQSPYLEHGIVRSLQEAMKFRPAAPLADPIDEPLSATDVLDEALPADLKGVA